MNEEIKVLDSGYVKLIETWGSDERIIESARMSTAKGFLGWGPRCRSCQRENPERHSGSAPNCAACGGLIEAGDEKLLKYLWDHEHQTPFEMAGITIEVKAPIMVFREWHRHRVPFGYNEMSARYVPLPNENYIPSVERILMANQATANKQAQAVGKFGPVTEKTAETFQYALEKFYAEAQRLYEEALDAGIPKELARVCLPVGRYSAMRATGNLRGWLGFMKLRCAPGAQYEIRVYANEIAKLVREHFPRTYEVAREKVGMP